ncbi:MAG TPA: phosphopantothenoylcysteine decarboxylase, partial [Deferrisomatales bacterium]|nr:phosphopantothenoylcysteine decarboxylase [Deferrisomatales bacterium]
VKLKKGAESPGALALEANPDILAELGRTKRPGQILLGFAAETTDVTDNARRKLEAKRLDVIVANDVTSPRAGFHADTNTVQILIADGDEIRVPNLPKDRVADRILGVVAKLRAKG